MTNVVDLLTGGQPIETDVNAQVTLDNSVYMGIAITLAGIFLIMLFFFVLHKYA